MFKLLLTESESSSSFSVVLESLVDAVHIEPAASPEFAGLLYPDRISVLPSTVMAKHYFHLRPYDTIDLREDGVKIAVMAEIRNSTDGMQPPSDGDIVAAGRPAEVQVKSSNADSSEDAHQGGYDNETDSSDNDLDQTVTDLPKRPLDVGEVTPARARAVNQTIMETPNHTTVRQHDAAVLPNEDLELYSTAREPVTSDTVMLPNSQVDSPTTLALTHRAGKPNSLKDSPLAPMEIAERANTPSESDTERDDQAPSGRRVFLQQVPDISIKETSSDGAESRPEQDIDEENEQLRYSPDPAATSDPLDAKGVARAAASGSIAVAKRKFSDVGDEDDDDESADHTTSSSKRQKQYGPTVVHEQYQDQVPNPTQDDMDEASQDATDSNAISIEKSDLESDADDADATRNEKLWNANKKGKLRISTRHAMKSTPSKHEEQSDTEDAELDRDVKPIRSRVKVKPAKTARRSTRGVSTQDEELSNSSPVVVVAAQRPSKKRTRTSNSLPSSTASSTLISQVPSILLSNDSPHRKGATASFLKSHNAPIIDDVKSRRAHFVCVLKGDKLTTTAKVLRSIALGKLVVTANWITESKEAKKLLDPDDFVHPELKPTINKDRHAIFQNTNLFFTKTLANSFGQAWKDIQALAKDAGANHVEEGDSGSFGVFQKGKIDVICFGQKGKDADVGRLQKQARVKVYDKELLIRSVLKGELDLDGEEYVL